MNYRLLSLTIVLSIVLSLANTADSIVTISLDKEEYTVCPGKGFEIISTVQHKLSDSVTITTFLSGEGGKFLVDKDPILRSIGQDTSLNIPFKLYIGPSEGEREYTITITAKLTDADLRSEAESKINIIMDCSAINVESIDVDQKKKTTQTDIPSKDTKNNSSNSMVSSTFLIIGSTMIVIVVGISILFLRKKNTESAAILAQQSFAQSQNAYSVYQQNGYYAMARGGQYGAYGGQYTPYYQHREY